MPHTNEFKPDWTLSLKDNMVVKLTLALSAHLPDWPGATDEQLDAIAEDLTELVIEAVKQEREANKAIMFAHAEEVARLAADPSGEKQPGVAEVAKSVADTVKKVTAAIEARGENDS
jgi:hypothetical protein